MEHKEMESENNNKELVKEEQLKKEDQATKKAPESSEENEMPLVNSVSLGKHLLSGSSLKKGISVSVRGRAANAGANAKQAGSAWKKKDEKNNEEAGEEKEKKIDDESFPDLLESTEKIKSELSKDKDKKKKQLKDFKKGDEHFLNNNAGLEKMKINGFPEKKKFGMNMFEGQKKNENNQKKWFEGSADVSGGNNNAPNENNEQTVKNGYIMPGFKGKHMIGFRCFLKRGLQSPAPLPPTTLPQEENFFFENVEQKGGMQKKSARMGQQVGQTINMPMGQPLGQPLTMPMGQPLTMSMGQPLTMPMGQPLTMPMGQPLSMPMGQPLNMQMGQPLNMQMNFPMNNMPPNMQGNSGQQRNNQSSLMANLEGAFERGGLAAGGMDQGSLPFASMATHNNQNKFNDNGGNMMKGNNFNRSGKNFANSNSNMHNAEDMVNAKVANNASGGQGNNANHMKRNEKREDRNFRRKDIDTESNWRVASSANRNSGGGEADKMNTGGGNNSGSGKNVRGHNNSGGGGSGVNMGSMAGSGMVPNGMTPNGMAPNGINPNGINPNGMNPNGMNPNGMTSNNVKGNFGNGKMANMNFQGAANMAGNNKNIFMKSNEEAKNNSAFKGNNLNSKNEMGGEGFGKMANFGNANNSNNQKFDFNKNSFGGNFGSGNKVMHSMDLRKARMREMRNMNEQNSKVNEG
ncbi:unnamed protein product [Plasmodium vivax]|uniref:(malaria parasite P. vivax) hypothetical protein n=1 Tax=Plasmodium vivax TaxID=5855 RepID=A0A8S4HC70_PLAVI|nr:unnamed protein product [Plasmodium vivax]